MTILYRIDRELSLAKEIRTEPTIEFESE
jgi:hypothetical protein